MKSPECTICGTPLEHTPQGWKCPVDGFYFNVKRGKAGSPLLRPVEAEPPAEKVEVAKPVAETFEDWLARHGVTPEMYDGADGKTKQDLKTAFYQRHREEPDVALFPPL